MEAIMKIFNEKLNDVKDVILEALNDYKKWYDGSSGEIDDCDKGKLKKIKKAIKLLENV